MDVNNIFLNGVGSVGRDVAQPMTKLPVESGAEQPTFADTIQGFLNAVNDDQHLAAQKVTDIVQGRSENLAEAMSALEESRLSFTLMLEIRNRLLESYQELNRISI
jgi:flagellar hook-basal body complex protein FliE